MCGWWKKVGSPGNRNLGILTLVQDVGENKKVYVCMPVHACACVCVFPPDRKSIIDEGTEARK